MAFDRTAYSREYKRRRMQDPEIRARENARKMAYYRRHRDARIAKTAAWKAKNRERYLAYMRKYNARVTARRAALRAKERAAAVYAAWRAKGVE